MLNVAIDKFERFFEVEGASFIVASIFFSSYNDLGTLIINKDNNLSIFLDRNKTRQTRQDGLDLLMLSNFERYVKDFSSFLSCASMQLDEILVKDEYSSSDLRNFFAVILSFFKYYRKTEFFYTDLAFSVQSPSVLLLSNLSSLGKIKTEGRVFLNSFFLGTESYMEKLLRKLSFKTGILVDDLKKCSFFDVINLNFESKVNSNQNYLLISNNKKKFWLLDDIEIKLTLKLPLNIIRGQVANGGVVKGLAFVIEPNYNNFDNIIKTIQDMGKGDVLVSESTSPELSLAIGKASAIVTNQGGMGSHAAILSRELKIPCIVGTGNATKIIHSGDMLLVDANKGIVKIL